MDMMEGIYARCSVRNYEPRPVERPLIETLLAAAVQAPSAMNAQPWAFGVITGVDALRAFSDRAKAYLLERLDDYPLLARYRGVLRKPEFNLFYDAPALVLIYAVPEGPQPQGDCCLAAENLMLAACAHGLGSCWIGLAQFYANTSKVKTELGVPDDYQVVAPLALGYPAGEPVRVEKRPPRVIFWKE